MASDPELEAVQPGKPPRKRDAGELGTLTVDSLRGGSRSWGKSLWHARGVNRFPMEDRLFGDDPTELIRDWIIPGSAPDEPMLSVESSVITMGSCFARELREYLSGMGFTAGNFWVPSGLNNTFAILDFVSWCITGEQTDGGFRYNRVEGEQVLEWQPEAERTEYVEGMRRAGAFVFTLGLAEVWQDRETGQTFWRGVPEHLFEPDRHEFRVSSVEENEVNIARIVELIRTVNEDAPIVLTLSPVPLLATFRDIACIPADCVSKSVLRVALDRVMSRRLAGVYYWPSFEIVRWLGAHVPWKAYGADGANSRNVNRQLVSHIIDAFVEAFFTPAAVAELRARIVPDAAEPPPGLRARAEEKRRHLRKRRRRAVRHVQKSKPMRRAKKLPAKARKRVRSVLARALMAVRRPAGKPS